MKNYEVQILTQKSGIVKIKVSQADDINALSEKLQKQYGDFVTLKTTEL